MHIYIDKEKDKVYLSLKMRKTLAYINVYYGYIGRRYYFFNKDYLEKLSRKTYHFAEIISAIKIIEGLSMSPKYTLSGKDYEDPEKIEKYLFEGCECIKKMYYELITGYTFNENIFKYTYPDDVAEKMYCDYNSACNMGEYEKAAKILFDINSRNKLGWFFKGQTLDKNNPSFIGHSVFTYSDSYTDFSSRYISCSYFDGNHLRCFHENFGFIMDPLYIIAAAPYDLAIDNNAPGDYFLSSYIGHLPMIESVESLQNHKDKTCGDGYSDNEVVINDFKPLGIFRFTFGIEGFDEDRREFHLFKNANPEYKVYEFDFLEVAKGLEVEIRRDIFMTYLETYLNDDYRPYSHEDLDKFDGFFEELSKLKKEGRNTIEDVKGLFYSYCDTTFKLKQKVNSI